MIVAGIFPDEDSIHRRIGALALETDAAWQLQHRALPIESKAELAAPAALARSLTPGSKTA